MRHQVRAARAVVAVAVLVALVVTGCGRRGGPVAEDAAANRTVATAATTSGLDSLMPSPGSTEAAPLDASPVSGAEATDQPAPDPTSAPPAPDPTSAPPAPTDAPFEAPDLTAIQRLLVELDAALDADATADSEEGSAP